MEKTKPTEVTQDIIDNWKKQHGDIYCFEVENDDPAQEVKKLYCKKPGRKTLSYASTVGTTDPMKFNEIILNECSLGGDMEILTNDEDFLAVSGQLGELIKFKEAKLVKL